MPIQSDMAVQPVEPSALITVALVSLALAVVIWRSAWVVLLALAGAILGAAIFLPSGSYIADGYSDCATCGYYVTLRIGDLLRIGELSIRGEHYGPAVAFGAALGTFFAVGAWSLRRKSRGWAQLQAARA